MRDPMGPSIFVQYLGDSPTIRVLNYLIESKGFDYPLSEIAELSYVSWSTMHAILKRMLKQGTLVKTRKVGRAQLYRLNEKSEFVKRLIAFDWEITRLVCDPHIEKELAKLQAKQEREKARLLNRASRASIKPSFAPKPETPLPAVALATA